MTTNFSVFLTVLLIKVGCHFILRIWSLDTSMLVWNLLSKWFLITLGYLFNLLLMFDNVATSLFLQLTLLFNHYALKFLPQVILATNIAESSVTIPKVAYVIDSCRSLQVYWDNNQRKDSAHVVWISKSQVYEPMYCLTSCSHKF